MNLIGPGVHNAKRQLLFPLKGLEVDFEGVTIAVFDADHSALPYRFSHRLLAEHALIGEDSGDLDGHLFTRARLPQIDHHRDARTDGYPFIATVDVAVTEPASPPVRLSLDGAFGRVFNVLSIRNPDRVVRMSRKTIGGKSGLRPIDT